MDRRWLRRVSLVAGAVLGIGVIASVVVFGASFFVGGDGGGSRGVIPPGTASPDGRATPGLIRLGSTSPDDQWVVAVDPATAPPGNPIVWFRDGVDDRLLVAYDWSGKRAGEMRVEATEPFGATQSPDGTAIVLLHGKPASGGTLVGPARGHVTWAGDSKHLCAFLDETGQLPVPTVIPIGDSGFQSTYPDGALYLEDPARATATLVAAYGQFGPHGGPEILSCNAEHDRAIVGSRFVGHVSDVRGYRLSDGAALGAPGFASPSSQSDPASVVVSADGNLVAVGSTSTEWLGDSASQHNQFVIREIDAGTTLATLPGEIVAFSGDGSLVLIVDYVGNSNVRGVYRVVDWRSGREVWKAELPNSVIFVRPASGDFMLEPIDFRPAQPGANSNEAYTKPIVVHSDGTVTLFATEVRPVY